MINLDHNDELKYGLSTLLLLLLAVLFPTVTDGNWFNMIVRIREAITTGDSSHLILSAASSNFLYAVQNTLVFLSIACLFSSITHLRQLNAFIQFIGHFLFFVFISLGISLWINVPWEPLDSIIAALATILFTKPNENNRYPVFRIAVISIQIFFAFSWLNVMPMFSIYNFGISDVSTSIKLTALYLESDTVLNFIGFAFFTPMFLSGIITSILFLSYDKNIQIAEENYQKEKALDDIRSKAMENRIYEEINSLTHDLKTPLVTIRGLNSLLSISKDPEKITDYTDRIENAVSKMSEMISSFLYDSSRQLLGMNEIIQYVRAQIPVEDDYLNIHMEVDESLPKIFVNKIRVVRALINIIENAIIVKTNHPYKEITIRIYAGDNENTIEIKDNGIGIPQDRLQKIFEPGYSTNRTSGLGLSFAKKVIEDNGGTIHLISKENIGTSVIVTFKTETTDH